VRKELYLHAKEYGDNKYIYPIYAEVIASKLRAKLGHIDKCFAELNKEGLLSHRVNGGPHDSKRSRYGTNTGWQASMYFLCKGKFDKPQDELVEKRKVRK
jgi:hypothetical protein